MEAVKTDDLKPMDQLQLARNLVASLESGAEHDASDIIDELAGSRDRLLFREVGRLTRELHTAINDFMLDSRIADLAQNEIPDAAERLRYVITMTEQAADTTLSAVEASLPLSEEISNDASRLAERWQKFNSRKLTVGDFRHLSEDLGTFLRATQDNSKRLHDQLSEVLMAQGFQDLTGQIIRRVIDLVSDLEDKLVQLVRIAGSAPQKEEEASGPDIAPAGPAVPGVDKGDLVSGQDDVDDLLSSLGF